MKHLFNGLNLVGAFALLVLAAGCAGNQTQNKENLLIAAGFKVIVPKTAIQQQNWQKAGNELQEVLDAHPDNARAHYLYAQVLDQLETMSDQND